MTKTIQIVPQPRGEDESRPATPSGWLSRFAVLLVLLVGAGARGAFSQALPAAEAAPISTGFSLPLTAGTLQYAVSASESLIWGYYSNSGVASSANVTGDVAYISNSKRDPFSMILSGGHAFSTGGQPSFNYVSLALSQVIAVGRWSFVLSDSVSYIPSTPAGGLSGVPGVGDLGVPPVQVGNDTGQGVLTNYSSRVSNSASGSAQRQITSRTSASASGSYSILRFLNTTNNSNTQGLDSDSLSAQGGVSHQFNERNTMGGSYSYSNYTFVGNTFDLPAYDFHSQTASLQFTHKFTRKLGMSAAAGPQWTTIQATTSSSSLNLFADVSASYAGKFTHSALDYVHSTNGGYGASAGGLSDSVQFSAARIFARVWSGAVSSSYTHTASLPTPGLTSYSFHTTVAGVQVSRAIARSLSTYASYTLEKQSTHGSVVSAIDLFIGSSHVVGFGITYSPTSIHIGRP